MPNKKTPAGNEQELVHSVSGFNLNQLVADVDKYLQQAQDSINQAIKQSVQVTANAQSILSPSSLEPKDQINQAEQSISEVVNSSLDLTPEHQEQLNDPSTGMPAAMQSVQNAINNTHAVVRAQQTQFEQQMAESQKILQQSNAMVDQTQSEYTEPEQTPSQPKLPE